MAPVGTTQYVDAFQRANFWNAPGFDAEDYHVLLSSVITLPAIFIDVPANEGLALTDGNPFPAGSFCAPMLLVDISWFDAYLNGTVLPELAESGVGPDTLPVFTVYNTGFPVADVTNLGNCCALGTGVLFLVLRGAIRRGEWLVFEQRYLYDRRRAELSVRACPRGHNPTA